MLLIDLRSLKESLRPGPILPGNALHQLSGQLREVSS